MDYRHSSLGTGKLFTGNGTTIMAINSAATHLSISRFKRSLWRNRVVRCAGIAGGLFALATLCSGQARATVFVQTNLVTNNQAVNPALIQDPNLVNPWGVSFSSSSPFWVSDNGTGVATLYNVNPTTNATVKQGLTVSIPGAGNPTGQVFNSNSAAFNGNAFLFVSEDGTISGWRGALGTSAETLVAGSTRNVYKGAALGTVSGSTYLYAANFATGKIDVVPGAASPALTGNFIDPGIPAGFAPFNIQNIGGKLYVSYAKQDAAKTDDVAGAGNGYISQFDLNGNFIQRIASNGTLNSPWGLAIAPTSFGSFAGDLLVGNFGDGQISAFDPITNTFAGQLDNPNGTPVAIDGLWALTVGNNGGAGSSQALYFSAGPDDESNGLFGTLSSVPEPLSMALFGLGLGGIWMARRRGHHVGG